MPKGKVIKEAGKIVSKGLKRAGKSDIGKKAKLGAGAVATERATDVLDNPYISAAEGAIIGGAVGGVPGAIAGGLIGFVLADGERITPIDMIAVPAYQYSAMLQGREPTFQIFIKEGELIAPVTQTEYMESVQVVDMLDAVKTKPKRKLSAWHKYIKNKKNQVFFKSGKKKGQLNLKKMGQNYRRGKK